MFIHYLLQPVLLLVAYSPFLASSRSIPNSIRYQVSAKAVEVETVQASGNSYARTLKLSDGTLLLGYAHESGTARTLEVSISKNDGQSFEPYSQITHRDSHADLSNLFLIEVGSTNPPTVLAAFRNHDKDDNDKFTYFRITICQSLDGGKTWEYLSQAVEFSADSTDGWGVWEPFMRIGDDGNIQLTYSGELSAHNQETFRTISSDGKSWSTPVDLQIHKESEQLRDGMQGIIKVKDQKDQRDALVMVFETTTRGEHAFNVEYAVSYDDGATYAARGNLYTPADAGRQAGSPQIINTGGDNLAVVFMTDEDMGSPNWPDVAQVKAVTSSGLKAGTIEWTTTPQVVGDGNSHWPGLLQFDGKVLGTFDQNGVVKAQIIDFRS